MEQTQEISSGACVYKIEGKQAFIILIQPRISKNAWGFPKGHVDPGEEVTEAAKREVFEEAGVEINLEEKLGVVVTKSSKKRNQKKYVHIWLATQVDDAIPKASNDPDDEVELVRWHNIDNLPDVHFYQKPLVLRAVRFLKEKIRTSIDI